VTATTPLALVKPVTGATLPQAPGVPPNVNITGTLAIAAPPGPVTVALIVEVLTPSAWIEDGLAVTVTTIPTATGL
jgi:hypothetical protein